MAERDLELWRANFLALALWRVAHGEARWVELAPQDPAPRGAGRPRVYAGGPSHPAFLPVYVPRSPAGDPPHELRLYRETYQAFLRGLSLGERQALEAYLGLGRARRLLYWHAITGRFRRADGVGEDTLEVFLRLTRLCAVIPLDKDQAQG
uniref:Uncharacterized protein n=1 Tax=Thermus islandicus TaxID=540988 RepID=A0A7C2C0R8_9DEIN